MKARNLNAAINAYNTELKARYAPIQEDEVAMKKNAAAISEVKGRLKVIQAEATLKTQRLAELDARIQAAQAEIVALDTAFYPPKFELTDTKSYQERILEVRAKVISNVGSFGEDVVKIGMTRREDSDDRVRELGDASVPFLFDTHAMIYSDDAPGLEASLHRAFDDRRVNTENRRKEFFRVSIGEVEAKVRELAPDAVFRRDREAAEWRRTMEKRGQVIANL